MSTIMVNHQNVDSVGGTVKINFDIRNTPENKLLLNQWFLSNGHNIVTTRHGQNIVSGHHSNWNYINEETIEVEFLCELSR